MNSLQELNTFGNASVTYTDSRSAAVKFDRVTSTTQTVSINQHDTHPAQPGYQIIDIIRPTDCLPTYTINVSAITGATVSWTTVPSGCTVTNPTTGVYRISGVSTVAKWNIIRNPVISFPVSYVGTSSYTCTLTWNTTQTKTSTTNLTVVDIDIFGADPSDFYFLGGIAGTITGNPVIIDNYSTTWTATVTPSTTSLITSLSSAGTGGTSSFNGTTKVLTIAGTKTQVNSHLNSISYVIPSSTKQDFTLEYGVDNVALSEGDSRTQQFYTTEWLSPTLFNGTYSSTTADPIIVSDVALGPIITDDLYTGDGTYTMTVVPSDLTAVSSMSATTPNYYPVVAQTASSSLYFLNNLVTSDLTYFAGYTTYSGYTPTEIIIYKRTVDNIAVDATVSLNLSSGVIDDWKYFNSDASLALISRGAAQPTQAIIKSRSVSTWTTAFTVTPNSGNYGYTRYYALSPVGDQFCVLLSAENTSNTWELYFYDKSSGSWALNGSMITGPTGEIGAEEGVFFAPDGNTLFVYRSNDTSFRIYKKTSGTWAYSQTISSTELSRSRMLPNGKFAAFKPATNYTDLYQYTSGTWTFESSLGMEYPNITIPITLDEKYYATSNTIFSKGIIGYKFNSYLGSDSLSDTTGNYQFSITGITVTEVAGPPAPTANASWDAEEANQAGDIISYEGVTYYSRYAVPASISPLNRYYWQPVGTAESRWKVTVNFSGNAGQFAPVPGSLGVIISGSSNPLFNDNFHVVEATSSSVSFWWTYYNPGTATGTGTVTLTGLVQKYVISSNGTYVIGGERSSAALSAIKLYKPTANDPNKSSWNSTTDTLTLRGNREQVNTMLNTITLTPVVAYAEDIVLTYTVTTPNGNTDSRSQDIDHTS